MRAGPELVEAQRRPVIEFAETMLDRLHRRVRKRGRNFAQLAPGDRHRLRIACKKLRYGTEFFASLFAGRRARDYAAMLGRLQDCLGHMNDIAVTRRLVDSVMTSAPRSDRRRVSAGFAAGVVVGWHAQAATIVEPEARRLWKELKKTQPFWRRPE